MFAMPAVETKSYMFFQRKPTKKGEIRWTGFLIPPQKNPYLLSATAKLLSLLSNTENVQIIYKTFNLIHRSIIVNRVIMWSLKAYCSNLLFNFLQITWSRTVQKYLKHSIRRITTLEKKQNKIFYRKNVK